MINLSRTIRAIRAYDDAMDRFQHVDFDHVTTNEALALLEEVESRGRYVGHAFGLDTSDRNSIDTCIKCVGPGPKTPSPGAELSFVRRMCRDYHDPNLKPIQEF